MKKIILNILLSLFLSTAAFADTFTASQGDVLRLEAPQNAGTVLSVQAFGKTWPIFKHQGKRIAWIGIHLKIKPNTYPLTWTSNEISWRHNIEVKKGEFRISRITVEKKMDSFDKQTLKRIRADQQAIKKSYQTKVSRQNTWPEMIQPVQGIISTPFAAQRYINGNPRSPHSGLDIAAPEGTSVVSPLNGTVLLVADMYLNGNLIAIGHGDGLVTVYAHLKQSLVKEGDQLKQGQVFAKVGSTGRSTGAHLHWGVHFAGAKINPSTMLSPNLTTF